MSRLSVAGLGSSRRCELAPGASEAVPRLSRKAQLSAEKVWGGLWCRAAQECRTRPVIKHLALDHGDPYGGAFAPPNGEVARLPNVTFEGAKPAEQSGDD